MNNLFSIFDPMAGTLNLPLNWLSTLCGIAFIPQIFWLIKNRISTALTSVLNFLHNEFIAILGSHTAPGVRWITISLLIFILFNNFLGLFPYVFTSRRHLRFTLSLALPLWVGHVLISWVKQPVSILAHLVPLGTPYPLIPFMVVIELVRNVIRPGTLAVRLAANMVAGHLLLTLLGSIAPSCNVLILTCIMGGLILLMTLECAVALIQSYVFSILMTLYVEEVSSTKIATTFYNILKTLILKPLIFKINPNHVLPLALWPVKSQSYPLSRNSNTSCF